jgi:molybdopterin converting factor small subunit
MSVEVSLHQSMRPLVDGQSSVAVSGDTVGACLEDLIRLFPAMQPKLFDRKGKLFYHVEIYVNTESAYPEELAKPVKDGDLLSITLIISGG